MKIALIIGALIILGVVFISGCTSSTPTCPVCNDTAVTMNNGTFGCANGHELVYLDQNGKITGENSGDGYINGGGLVSDFN